MCLLKDYPKKPQSSANWANLLANKCYGLSILAGKKVEITFFSFKSVIRSLIMIASLGLFLQLEEGLSNVDTILTLMTLKSWAQEDYANDAIHYED